MKLMTALVLLVAIAPFACKPIKEADRYVPPNPRSFDGGLALDETDAGDEKLTPEGKACRNLRTLKCPEGERTKTGATCVDYMTNAKELVSVDCIIAASSVAQLKTCNVRCLP